MGLNFTFELPKNHQLQFLDLRLTIGESHMCWKYDPRSVKPTLNYNSGHSKIVKRAITKTVLNAALKKSCIHMTKIAFDDQVTRLKDSGYPNVLISSVCESMLLGVKNITKAEKLSQMKKEKTR